MRVGDFATILSGGNSGVTQRSLCALVALAYNRRFMIAPEIPTKVQCPSCHTITGVNDLRWTDPEPVFRCPECGFGFV